MKLVFTTPKDKGLNSLLGDLSSLENEKVISAPSAEKTKKAKKEKEPKKGKKKKKEDDGIELLSVSNGYDGVSLEECEDQDIARMMSLLDVDELMNKEYGDEGNFSDPIINTQRGAYSKRKKDSNEYKKEFAEELTLLYDLLGDTRKFSEKLRKFIDLDGKQIGAVSKTMSDLVTNYLDSQKTQLQTLKEISTLKKVAVDLKLKADSKKDKDGGESGNDSLAIASLINGIMKTGRGDFSDAVRGGASGFLPQDDAMDYIDMVPSSSYSHLDEDDDDNDELMNTIEHRLTESGYLAQTAETDAYLKYEGRDVRTCIRMNSETGEWDFIALDRDEIVITDYPLPEKRETEPMKFNGHMAVDRRGVQYRIIEV